MLRMLGIASYATNTIETGANTMKKGICEKCGTEYFKGEKFCAACGGRVIDKKKRGIFPVIASLLLVAVLGISLVLWGGLIPKSDGSLPENSNAQTSRPEGTEAVKDLNPDYYISLVGNPSPTADGFWASAVPRDWNQGGGKRYDAFDENLNYLYSLDGERYEAYGGIFEGYALAKDHENDEKLAVIDPSGRDITDRFVVPDSYGWIVGLCKDETGVTVWNCEYRTNEAGIGVALCAKDINGREKSIYTVTDYLSGGRGNLTFYGGSVYRFNTCVLNVSTGAGKAYLESETPHTFLGVDEENNYFIQFLEEDYTTIEKFDTAGENLWTIALEAGAEIGTLHNGHMYVDGIQMDTHRKLHGLLTPQCQGLDWVPSDVAYKNTPVFTDGCAPVEFENENGESVVTLLNLKGEMMYPPIPGTVVPRNEEYANEFNIAERLVLIDEGLANLNEDGTTTVLNSVDTKLHTCLIRCGKHIYRVEDGKIFEDTELKAELARANPSSMLAD